MTTIYKGSAAALAVVLRTDGAPLAIDQASAVKGRLYSIDGGTPLTDEVTVAPAAGWADGQVTVPFTDVQTGSLELGECMLVVTSTAPAAAKRFRVVVELLTTIVRSDLFVRDFAIEKLRTDRLTLAAATAMQINSAPTDDYLWEKLVAAESQVKHTLRVPLVPTAFFPMQPTGDQIAALNGIPWEIDPGYDYLPDFFHSSRWGYIQTRHKPLLDVSRVRISFPSASSEAYYNVPADWFRMDKKYGVLQFVPTSGSGSAPLNAFMLQALGMGRDVPFAIQLTYRAGLENAQRDYPELVDAILKKAVLKVVEDFFLPQSGSISADGLSQSVSADMDKYRDNVDVILNGPPGVNGGLMAALHGVRVALL